MAPRAGVGVGPRDSIKVPSERPEVRGRIAGLQSLGERPASAFLDGPIRRKEFLAVIDELSDG